MRRAGDARELDPPIDPIERDLERLSVLPGRRQAARDAPGVLELDAGVVGSIVALPAAFDDVVALVEDQQRLAGDVRPEVAAGDERGPEVAALGMAAVGELAQRVGQRRGFGVVVVAANLAEQLAGAGARLGAGLASEAELEAIKRLQRTLGGRIEAAQALDIVAEELDAHGGVVAGRPEVDDAAANGVVGGLHDERRALVAGRFERGDHAVAADPFAALHARAADPGGQRGLGDRIGVGDHDRVASREGVKHGEARLDHVGIGRLALVRGGFARGQRDHAAGLQIGQPGGERLKQLGGVARRGGDDHHGAGVLGSERRDHGGLGGVGHAKCLGLAEPGDLAGDRLQERREERIVRHRRSGWAPRTRGVIQVYAGRSPVAM